MGRRHRFQRQPVGGEQRQEHADRDRRTGDPGKDSSGRSSTVALGLATYVCPQKPARIIRFLERLRYNHLESGGFIPKSFFSRPPEGEGASTLLGFRLDG